jgi:hypothetical protein
MTFRPSWLNYNSWLTLWRQNPKVHHRVYNPPVVRTLSHLNPLHTHPVNLPRIPSDPILPSTPRSSEWSLSVSLFHRQLVHFSVLSKRATCHVHLVLLDLIRLIFGEEQKLWSPHCATPSGPVTLSLLGPNILLRILFSNILSLCYPLMLEIKFHIHTKQLEKLWFCIF